MSDVIFKCHSCSMNLCAGDSAIGSSFSCPSCQGQVTLPEPDYSFNCPSCGTQYLVPQSMGNETFQCPSCNNTFTIPMSGAKYLRPLKARPKTITCLSCSSQLEVDDRVFIEMAGQEVECPVCKGRITIPQILSKKSLFKPLAPLPLKASVAAPSSAPQPLQPIPSAAGCPECKKEMPKNAVICTSCGFDLRTGQKIAVGVNLGVDLKEEKKESKLSFKNRDPENPTLNPALARHNIGPFSSWQGIMMWFKFKSALKTTASVLAVVIGLIAVLCFVDFGNPEADSWKIAVQSLRTLKSNPANKNALEAIKGIIPNVANGTTGSTPKCGLMTVWAIGQLELGNVDKGFKACKWIEDNYRDNWFADNAAPSNFSNTCQGLSCAVCGGRGKLPGKKLDVPA